MNTKLTLTVEKEVIEKAKIYAKNSGKSLSNIIENYLKTLTRQQKENKDKISPSVKSLMGSFKMPPDFNYKAELTKGLNKKYSQ